MVVKKHAIETYKGNIFLRFCRSIFFNKISTIFSRLLYLKANQRVNVQFFLDGKFPQTSPATSALIWFLEQNNLSTAVLFSVNVPHKNVYERGNDKEKKANLSFDHCANFFQSYLPTSHIPTDLIFRSRFFIGFCLVGFVPRQYFFEFKTCIIFTTRLQILR